MKILDGKIVAKKILREIKNKIARHNLQLAMAVILVGRDPVSQLYVKIKERTANELGIDFRKFAFKENTPENKIINQVNKLNNDKSITGIIIQLPLPRKFNTEKIISAIFPEKDIDGLVNPDVIPPTPAGILEIICYYKINLQHKKVVMVGHGRLVGAPLAKILAKIPEKPQVIVCDSQTKNLAETTRQADILISAVGIPNLIKKNMVRNGAVVIDAGTSIKKIKNLKLKIKNYYAVGDVDFENVKEKCSYITPPKGGVGPATVAKLMENLVNIKEIIGANFIIANNANK